jgi:H+/Cl- antiporter ClcA
MDDQNVLLSAQRWKRRAALWSGATLVALVAIAFAKGADACFALFERMSAWWYWLPLVATPATFALLCWLTRGMLRATRGSGIPQVIAILDRREDVSLATRILALPISLGKIALTLMALLAGASVGREGPTVHVGAGLMVSVARRFGFCDPESISRFALAGAAAGIAAAFNTPLAGVVFAIEELAGAFENRFSGALLTAVMIAGVVSLGLIGDYAYFGKSSVSLPLGAAWLAVLATGLVGGLAGGLFARAAIAINSLLPGHAGRMRRRFPVGFAALCGLLLAVLGLLTHGDVFGTGYAQAHRIIEAQQAPSAWFGVAKWTANTLSFAAGIPGGIFSPALAAGAGFGANIAALFPDVNPSAVALLGMAAYLAGATQVPLTSAVISMELTDNHELVLPIIAACLLGRAFSTLICRTSLYRALAEQLQHDPQFSGRDGAGAGRSPS